MQRFVSIFSISNSSVVLDVGVSQYNWDLISEKPEVTILNVDISEDHREDRFIFQKGDGRNLSFGDKSYDVVFSNSVIEHVGSWEDQVKFAQEIQRVGKGYYVQTPCKSFFIEPHIIAPFLHFLPLSWQKRLVPYFSLRGLIERPSAKEIEDLLANIKLLGKKELSLLFPGATIIQERFLGMTKSLIAPEPMKNFNFWI